MLKKNPVVQALLKTPLGKTLRESHGDWRYPFICMGWMISSWLVPRRSVTCDGVTLNLSCINSITHFRWFLYATKEAEVRQYINDYVKDGDVFFDVGANVGVFTLYCAKRYQQSKVFSFEPEHSNLGLLKDNVLANNLVGQVQITSVAVSDTQGLSFLNIQDTMPGAAAHTENPQAIKMTDEGYQVVWREGIACFTLDALAAHYGVMPNALKIDTDGNEDKVLRGAAKILANKALRSLTLEMPMEDAKSKFCSQTLQAAGFALKWSRPDTRNQIWAR